MDFNEWEKQKYECSVPYLTYQLAGYVTVAAARGMRVSAVVWDEPIEVSIATMPSSVVEKQTYWGKLPYTKEVEPLQIHGAANASDPSQPDGLPSAEDESLFKLAEEVAKWIFVSESDESILYMLTGAIVNGFVPDEFGLPMQSPDQPEDPAEVAEVLRLPAQRAG